MRINWSDDELCLALELYLRKGGYKWLPVVSDETEEIITLSQILKNLTNVSSDVDDSYRSTGSVRLKLGNFQSIDPDYKKVGMSNAGKNDRRIWKLYAQDYQELSRRCKNVILECCNISNQPFVKKYLNEMGAKNTVKNKKIDEFCSLIKKDLDRLKDQTFESSTLREREEISALVEKIIGDLNNTDAILRSLETTRKKQAHPGINQDPICHIKNEQNDVDYEKIGAYVQRTFNDLIEHNQLRVNDIQKLTDLTWCRKSFKLNHPFLKKIKTEDNISSQRKDELGNIRYYKKLYEIHGSIYVLCKEWYEERRGLYEKWLISIGKNDDNLSRIKDMLVYLCEEDRKQPYIRISKLINLFSDIQAIDLVLEQLIDLGVLGYFNGDKSRIIVDDYEHLYSLMADEKKLKREFHL